MLNWLLGRQPEGNRTQDEHPDQEPPETPAPVFAARALKSAIFGTPALPDDDTVFDIETEANTMASKGIKKGQSGSISPTKPQGILLTPGTATSRRKTVSFGNEVAEKEEKIVDEMGATKGGVSKDYLGKVSGSLATKSEGLRRASRKTALTRTLENAREGRQGRDETEKPRNSSESQPLLNLDMDDMMKSSSPSRPHRRASDPQTNHDLMQEMITKGDIDGDVTTDLNEPHSQSGKFWKAECQNYHDAAQVEMRRLLKKKQMAKSYAKNKDEENIDLVQKLIEEQRRVISMEDKISKLSTRIAEAGLEGADDESPEMIKEQARQTALAAQYKSQVGEFKAALEGSDSQSSKVTASESKQPQGSLKESKDQPELVSLREEMRQLRQNLSTTEKANQKLQQENTKLTQELLHTDLRLGKHLEKCEKRWQSFEDLKQKKDDVLMNFQKDYDNLKEQAKSQRRDAEHLLKKRHDQVVELKKEIASIRGTESTVKDFQEALQKKAAEHDQMVAEYEIQIAELKKDVIMTSHGAMDLNENMAKMLQERSLSNPISSSLPSVEAHPLRESLIPVLSQSISRPLKSVAPSRQSRSETPTGLPAPRPQHSALSEIVNNASPNSLPPHRSGPVQYTPLAHRFSNMSIQSPDIEPSLPHVPSRVIHERNCQASPRPSMFNIASSPPKAVMTRSKPDEVSRQRSHNDLGGAGANGNTASSRLSSMEDSRARKTIPPERAAAAKARLEQKNAEKRRLQTSVAGKENIRT